MTSLCHHSCTCMFVFSGENISCDEGDAVFGRCSTAGNVDGACKKTSTNGKQLSHEIMCCKSKSSLDLPTCGWIYASSGTKTTCPSGFALGGMCGVHHKDNQKCATGTAYGLDSRLSSAANPRQDPPFPIPDSSKLNIHFFKCNITVVYNNTLYFTLIIKYK